MTEYAVTFARSARRELEAMERPLAHRILAKVEELTTEPRRRPAVAGVNT